LRWPNSLGATPTRTPRGPLQLVPLGAHSNSYPSGPLQLVPLGAHSNSYTSGPLQLVPLGANPSRTPGAHSNSYPSGPTPTRTPRGLLVPLGANSYPSGLIHPAPLGATTISYPSELIHLAPLGGQSISHHQGERLVPASPHGHHRTSAPRGRHCFSAVASTTISSRAYRPRHQPRSFRAQADVRGPYARACRTPRGQLSPSGQALLLSFCLYHHFLTSLPIEAPTSELPSPGGCHGPIRTGMW
jgi:hypothetical protein